MRVAVIGAGYVGLVTGLCLAEMGNHVVCIDVVQEKVDALNGMRCPLHEKGLERLLVDNVRRGRFRASSSLEEMAGKELTFICVNTPSGLDGALDLRYVLEAAKGVGQVLSREEGFRVIAVKSTVPPGATDGSIIPEIERWSGKSHGKDFGVAVNPEFLREGNAVEDFQRPDRIVIGTEEDRSFALMLSLYSPIGVPVLRTKPAAAEMIKLASNAFLAARISLVNEIGNICKANGIDVRDVAKGIGMDRRIGPDFLRAGCGFGGSCFPKDVKGLAALARQSGVDPVMLDGVLAVNERQPLRLVEALERHIAIKGSRIGMLGLAFKPHTDDVREAVSLKVARELLSRGAKVVAHDFEAMDNFHREVSEVELCRTPEECIERSDALLILTEWPGYSDPDLYGDKLVIDGRGVVRTRNYDGICW